MKDLLILHGAIGSKKQFAPLAEKLKNNFNVHTIDFSGHGGEEMPPSFTIEMFAHDVLNYLEVRNISKINIFGYSMGGFVGFHLVQRFPKKVEKLFTLATKFLWTPEIAAREIKMLDAGVIEEKIPAFAKMLAERHAPNDWKIVLKKTAGMMSGLGNTASEKNGYDGIEIPITIGIGDKDTMVTLEETIDVYRKLKNARLIVFPETPHPIEKINLDRLTNEINLFFK